MLDSPRILLPANRLVEIDRMLRLAADLKQPVILYGGREKPTQTGYVANKNLYSQVKCAPCWLRNPCEYDRKCMDMITAEQVIAATAEQIRRCGTLLEIQTAEI